MTSANQKTCFDHAALFGLVRASQGERRPGEQAALGRARFAAIAGRFCRRVSEACSEVLGQRSFAVRFLPSHSARAADCLLQHGMVIARLRIFQESLALLFPVEAVQHLLQMMLEQELTPALIAPEEKDLAAISFFLARAISRTESTGNQRIYLVSTNYAAAEEARSFCTTMPGELLTFDLSCHGSSYTALALVSPDLTKRISCYLDHALPLDGSTRLALAPLGWRVGLSDVLLPAADLLNLAPGKRIELSRTGNSALRCEIHSTRSTAKLVSTLQLTSEQGRCKFRIGTTYD